MVVVVVVLSSPGRCGQAWRSVSRWGRAGGTLEGRPGMPAAPASHAESGRVLQSVGTTRGPRSNYGYLARDALELC